MGKTGVVGQEGLKGEEGIQRDDWEDQGRRG